MKKRLIAFLFLLFLILTPKQVEARNGNQGCCSHHGGVAGCSGGSIVCSDGSYSPTCGCGGSVYTAPSYYLPQPVNPLSGNQTYVISDENWCSYDVTATWDKALSGDRYSVAISKSAGADPGPTVDTVLTSFLFKNIAPGKWYVNLKAGNSERWATNRVYWTLDLPKLTPSLYASINNYDNTLYYSFQCIKNISGPDFVLQGIKQNGNKPKGQMTIPLTAAQSFTISAVDVNGKKYQQDLNFTPQTPTPTIPPTTAPSSTVNTSNDSWLTSILPISVVLILHAIRSRFKKN